MTSDLNMTCRWCDSLCWSNAWNKIQIFPPSFSTGSRQVWGDWQRSHLLMGCSPSPTLPCTPPLTMRPASPEKLSLPGQWRGVQDECRPWAWKPWGNNGAQTKECRTTSSRDLFQRHSQNWRRRKGPQLSALIRCCALLLTKGNFAVR